MANKEKIDSLLLDIRELETLIANKREAEVYPVSFFSQTFHLTHKIMDDLHALEAAQIEGLRKQMEEHQALIRTLPTPAAMPQPTPAVDPVETPTDEPVVAPELASAPVSNPVQAETPRGNATTEKPGAFLSDLLQKKTLSDFRKAFSLNDRFRFRRELFGGDEEKMNQAIADLDEIHSYDASIAYLNTRLKWNIEDEAVADFIQLLEKRFL